MKTLVMILLFAVALVAQASGPKSQPTGATSSSQASATVNEDGGGRAIGLGSTGLTSTAPCMGSVGVIFNFISATYVEKGCVVRMYSQSCPDAKCRQAMACLDPDLLPEAKAVLGCK